MHSKNVHSAKNTNSSVLFNISNLFVSTKQISFTTCYNTHCMSQSSVLRDKKLLKLVTGGTLGYDTPEPTKGEGAMVRCAYATRFFCLGASRSVCP